MMKVSGLVVCAVLLASVPCMAASPLALPKLTYDANCQYVKDIDTQANAVIALIGTVVAMIPAGEGEGEGETLVIPPYEAMDLENGLLGDGIPDKFQLALLGNALCANPPGLVAQLEYNKAKFATLIADLDAVVAILLGTTSPAVAPAATRLTAVADILAAVPSPNPALLAIIAEIRSAATSIGKLAAQIPSTITQPVVGQLLHQLGTYSTAVGALIGLSTEMQQTVTNLVTDKLRADIAEIRGQVVAVIDAVPDLVQLTGLTTQQIAAINALKVSAQTIVAALDRTLALVNPGGILVLGVSRKTLGEPFSALGDYDADGTSNLVTYEANSSTIASFVAAASDSNEPMPVATILGLMALAGACTLGGAVSIRRRK